jgi:hypothetical protein
MANSQPPPGGRPNCGRSERFHLALLSDGSRPRRRQAMLKQAAEHRGRRTARSKAQGAQIDAPPHCLIPTFSELSAAYFPFAAFFTLSTAFAAACLVLPAAWSILPSRLSFRSPVKAPAASFTRPFISSAFPDMMHPLVQRNLSNPLLQGMQSLCRTSRFESQIRLQARVAHRYPQLRPIAFRSPIIAKY